MLDVNSKEDLKSYLEQHQKKDLLRFITCGSVDDGKSTLIGRLLHDSKLIYEDQLAAIQRESHSKGSANGEVDLALLVDGLQAEREQGITIDVAYRYFSTDKRKFIIADTPGHEQYTRNMATGASTADLAIILIDARKGVLTQTKRHTFIVSLLGIQQVVVAVNKMDMVDYKQSVFRQIELDYVNFAEQLGLANIQCIPVSALKGDNVVHRSESMPWYQGAPLIEKLETIPITRNEFEQFRFPIQYVNRPNVNFRGYTGTVRSGSVKVGDSVLILPSRKESTVERIVTFDQERESAGANEAVTITLNDELDISRGDMIVHQNRQPEVARSFEADFIWMSEDAILPERQYWLKLSHRYVTGCLTRLEYKQDVNTLEKEPADRLELNEVGVGVFQLNEPIIFDQYEKNRSTGSFVLIDRMTNRTVGAGMIRKAIHHSENIVWHTHYVRKEERATAKRQKPFVVWLTGLSGSGKSTVANALERFLVQRGYHTYLLDGDNVRHGLNRDLRFSDEDRVENIRRVGEVAKLMVDAGLIVITSFISPFSQEREMVRDMLEEDEFVEIYLNTPLEVCEERDPKGLYRKARKGEIKNFTGIDSDYEAPEKPDLMVDTSKVELSENIEKIWQYLSESKGL